jgi:hypothetical protein
MRPVTRQDVAALLRAPVRRPSSGEISRRADLAALRLVGRYGHCTVADIATSIYPAGRYATQSAQRVVKRLTERKPALLTVRRNALGGRSFVLSRPGAAFLEMHGTLCHHGMDLASVAGPTYRHHAITSRYCQMQELAGATAWTEQAIGQGLAPVSQRQVLELCGKLPDALLEERRPDGSTGRFIRAIETESARKGTAFLAKGLNIAKRASDGVNLNGFTLTGVTFVYDAEQDHAARIERVARSIWGERQWLAFAPHVALASVSTRLPLAFGEWQARSLKI